MGRKRKDGDWKEPKAGFWDWLTGLWVVVESASCACLSCSTLAVTSFVALLVLAL